MTLVGPASQNIAQTLGDGLGLVACCSALLVIVLDSKGYWDALWGRSEAGAYTNYGVGTGHVAYFPSDKNTR
jgi:hypothetical protein